MDFNITDLIIRIIIPLLGAIITYYIVPLLKEKNLYNQVEIAVKAAEQIFGANTGEQKFEYVKNWIKDKFKITDEELKVIIEAAVYEMNEVKKKTEKETKE